MNHSFDEQKDNKIENVHLNNKMPDEIKINVLAIGIF